MSSAAMLRMGRVAELHAATCRARVQFEDVDQLLSFWLPVMQSATFTDQSYRMPAVDELVVCLLDARSEFGVVLGAIYSDVDTPPVASLDRVHLAFGDGTSIDYNRATHLLEVVGGDGATVRVTAERVELGGAGGEKLVTKQWLTNVYAGHVHGTPAGATSTPIGGPAAVVPHITDRLEGR